MMSDEETNGEAPWTPPTPGENGAQKETLAESESMEVGGRGAAVIQGENIDIRGGGGAILVANQDMHIQEGGGSMLVAGGNMQVENGGGAVLIAGGDTTLRNGNVGVLIAGGDVELGEGARVLLNTPQALAFGAAVGVVFALVSFLLRRVLQRG